MFLANSNFLKGAGALPDGCASRSCSIVNALQSMAPMADRVAPGGSHAFGEWKASEKGQKDVYVHRIQSATSRGGPGLNSLAL